ncbi:MAG: AmmeMemoRadiSam system radical SAM enzyme [Candidatus Aminicenantes bacterium]|nr:AmmeMemoRadiSam system radical SAM enzyme [Candidatus Aminicenantes bacterium]
MMDRRHFIKTTGGLSLTAGSGLLNTCSRLYAFDTSANLSRKEARYYKKHPDREIECLLCPRFCKLGDRERGYCGVRENIDGTYYTFVYGKACAVHLDPIEKKPFFHFLPQSRTLSLATAGCNVNCKFCQNWEISQVRPEQVEHQDFPPHQVVLTAQKYDSPIIAYTYTEPIVFFEYMIDTSIEAQKAGLRNVVVTGGHINPEPLQDLLPAVDAIKIDLKAFSELFYTEYVRGKLQPVLDAIKIIAQSSVWLEIVYLVIPSLNDSPEEIRQMSRWLKQTAGKDVPLHFSRFYPMYLLKNLPPTPTSTLERCHRIAREEGLHYVYIGNIPGHKAENTYCPQCQKLLIQRTGYSIGEKNLEEGRCKYCGQPIPGIWK